MVDNSFAFCFKEASTSTTGGMEIEHVKFLGQVTTILRSVTSKDGDLLSYVDNVNTSMKNTSLNDRLINSHSVPVNRGQIK